MFISGLRIRSFWKWAIGHFGSFWKGKKAITLFVPLLKRAITRVITHSLSLKERQKERSHNCSFENEWLPNSAFPGLGNWSFSKWAIALFFLAKNERFGKSLIFRTFLLIRSFWKSERVITLIVALFKRATKRAIALLQRATKRAITHLLFFLKILAPSS